MSFQVDLDDLNTLANTDIPSIEGTCTDAQTAVHGNADQDASIFDGGADSTLYSGVTGPFAQARSDLENLLGTLSSSMDECAQALREIHTRYQDADDQNTATLKRIGSGQ